MKERIEKLIEDKLLEEDEKSQRDVAFLRSLRASYAKWGSLTDKQKSAFERIEFLSSPEGLQAAKEWSKEYLEKHQRKAKVVSLYYLKNTYFFRDLCSRIVSEPSFVPTKRQVEALCSNKYAKKVIKELERDPSYDKGSLVKVREANTVPLSLYPLRGRLCVVVENSLDSISSHGAGSKEYRLLPFGSTDTVVCQERHIKALRKRAK